VTPPTRRSSRASLRSTTLRSARGPRAGADARQRILDVAYELFAREGIHVGINRIIAESGVAKMTLYHYFPTKQDLVLAFLEVREQRWTRDWLQKEIERFSPGERPVAIFDVLDGWFHHRDYEGCSFTNTLLEIYPRTDSVYEAVVHHLDVIRELLGGYAGAAGVEDAEQFAYQMQTLALGAIVSAQRGDLKAATRAKEMAKLLLANQIRAMPGAGPDT
jgi:AcrR family transcriptional regulator